MGWGANRRFNSGTATFGNGKMGGQGVRAYSVASFSVRQIRLIRGESYFFPSSLPYASFLS